jgi:hypothetical protein
MPDPLSGAGLLGRRLIAPSTPAGGPPLENVVVDPDLVLDPSGALPQFLNLGEEALLVPTEKRNALCFVASPAFDETDVVADRRQRHSGCTQAPADRQPLNVIFGIHAVTIQLSLYGVGQDAFAFVEAQRVHAHARAVGDLADGQARHALSHAGQDNHLT